MLGCIFALVSLLSPRLGFIALWIFTNTVERSFTNFITPLLGLLFLPYTSIIYVLVNNPEYGVSGIGWFFVVFGFLVDVGSYSGSAYGNRQYITN
jgi:hypothetical protein